MSTLIVAIILIAIIAAIFLLFITVDKRQKRKHMNKLLKHFSELGSTYNLLFSSQTIIKDAMLGLDGINRKILILTVTEHDTFDHLLLDVDEIKTCSVRKTYGSIKNTRLKNLNLDQYLEEIILHFDFHTSRSPVEVPFYRHLKDPVTQAAELEQKAKDWEMTLSKMRQSPLKKTA